MIVKPKRKNHRFQQWIRKNYSIIMGINLFNTLLIVLLLQYFASHQLIEPLVLLLTFGFSSVVAAIFALYSLPEPNRNLSDLLAISWLTATGIILSLLLYRAVFLLLAATLFLSPPFLILGLFYVVAQWNIK